jgi:cell division GTPase FtsZ
LLRIGVGYVYCAQQSSVSYPRADKDQEPQVFQLAGAAFRLTEFCCDFVDADFDDFRRVIQSPGRIAILMGRGTGNDRVAEAFDEVVVQFKEQQFTRELTKKYRLMVSSSAHMKPIMVREHTELVKRIVNFIDTEPADVRMGFITDDRLWEQLVVNLLLWMPLEKSAAGLSVDSNYR